MLFTAKLVSENCKSSLLFNDTTGAHVLLSSLNSIPIILQASVYDAQNNKFASFSRNTSFNDSAIRDNVELIYFDHQALHISEPILQEHKHFGRFTMHISTSAINQKIIYTLLIFLIVFIIIMTASYYMSIKLQMIISRPILDLKTHAEDITNKSDYSIRIPITCTNEIGLLQKSFDIMVQQLDKNFKELKNEIDNRIISEHETLQLKLYLKSIIDSLSSAIIAVDVDGTIRQLNLEAQKLLKLEDDQAIHKPITDVLEFIKDKEILISRCIEECKPQKFQIVMPNANPTQQIYLNTTIYPLSQRNGVVIRIDDVTEKTKIEMMLIQNEKMISLGGLAAGMAHEINNPLGIITQGALNIQRHISPDLPKNLEIAKECGIDIQSLQTYLEKRKFFEYINGMLSAAKRASEIVSNMLHFSRMSNQSKTPSDIRQVVDQTIDLANNDYELKKKFDFRSIKLIKEYDDPIPDLLCNITEIQQVILNLLKNAAHALSAQKDLSKVPQINIRIKNEISQVRIDIEDNGTGIQAIHQKRIFEPFFTTKEVGVGTGLGLSVSFFIITKNHAGTIQFESVEGVGTKFIIHLPFADSSGVHQSTRFEQNT